MSVDGEVTLLFSDVEGSTALWERFPVAMSAALARHDKILQDAVEAEDGQVFKTVGDGVCAVFSDVAAAVRAAVEIQRGLGREALRADPQLRVRIGLHTGVCELRDDDYFGPTVNRVARLHAIAHGGQIVLSARASELLVRREAGVELRDLGEHRLKDLEKPERVFQACAAGLPDSFPPLRSLGNPQLLHNLHEQVSGFMGRQRELAEVIQLMTDSRLVTLTGAGGVGKTRLALQVAAELLDGSGDGVWFVDLAPLSRSGDVATAAARALRVSEEPGRSVRETLLTSLRDRELLMVLDNCEHVLGEVVALAADVLTTCPQVAILSTSREPLRMQGEHVYRVPSLSLPDESWTSDELTRSEALQLFLQRAREHGASIPERETGRVLASICRKLDGIPLAIELAASRVASLGLENLDKRLEHS